MGTASTEASMAETETQVTVNQNHPVNDTAHKPSILDKTAAHVMDLSVHELSFKLIKQPNDSAEEWILDASIQTDTLTDENYTRRPHARLPQRRKFVKTSINWRQPSP